MTNNVPNGKQKEIIRTLYLESEDVRNFSNKQLLSIIIQTKADELMDDYGSLVNLSRNIKYAERSGIRKKKIRIIEAAFELGRRLNSEELAMSVNANMITGSDTIFAIFNKSLSALPHEELWAIYTSKNGKLLDKCRIGVGGTDSAAADIKKIVAPAIRNMASGVALCHNHPHSSCRPSKADRSVTSEAIQALGLFGVRFLDHIIISDGNYYSFRDNGDI